MKKLLLILALGAGLGVAFAGTQAPCARPACSPAPCARAAACPVPACAKDSCKACTTPKDSCCALKAAPKYACGHHGPHCQGR